MPQQKTVLVKPELQVLNPSESIFDQALLTAPSLKISLNAKTPKSPFYKHNEPVKTMMSSTANIATISHASTLRKESSTN